VISLDDLVLASVSVQYHFQRGRWNRASAGLPEILYFGKDDCFQQAALTKDVPVDAAIELMMTPASGCNTEKVWCRGCLATAGSGQSGSKEGKIR